MITEFSYDDIKVGDSASFETSVTEKLVVDFAVLSGDTNPLHMDESYAAGTPFGGRVAHGMIAGALFSRLIGMHLPGKRALYLSQTLTFRHPMKIGMTLTVRGEVTHTTDAARTISVHTTVTETGTNALLVTGDALVKVLEASS